MPICDRCGKEFEIEDAEWEFTSGVYANHPVSYERLSQCLCGQCAIEAYESEDGTYTEICEDCGKAFEPISEEYSFEMEVSSEVDGADMYAEGIHCAECAARRLREKLNDSF